jgi:methanogenic corrinoid protein MtbC1
MSTDYLPETRGFERNRPEHVGALASRVISVLRERQGPSADGLRQFVLDHLLRAVLVRGHFDVSDLVAELRAHRVSVDAIIDLYIPRAAVVLGQRWVDDEIGFSHVTIGSLRLQSLLAEISGGGGVEYFGDRSRLHALIVVPQGEQHFLGANVVAAQLRRIGCEVAISFDEAHEALGARLRFDVPDLVLITAARYETLESVAVAVHVLRSELKNGPMIALGGAVVELEKNKNLKDLTGVDIVTSSAAEAVAFCAKSARARGGK